jgi:hypothetical protein
MRPDAPYSSILLEGVFFKGGGEKISAGVQAVPLSELQHGLGVRV